MEDGDDGEGADEEARKGSDKGSRVAEEDAAARLLPGGRML